ncbi:uncharacterized protein LOC116001240 [Ipomoea triloba]|uniref:uncharacterized protein LOC116001240 n=1 Tax=Ipomoea triloba TaxID=35885 RepID=UPI00125DC999|nr:uncharacterized protein LOC116001240 [Ipomoea triloba]
MLSMMEELMKMNEPRANSAIIEDIPTLEAHPRIIQEVENAQNAKEEESIEGMEDCYAPILLLRYKAYMNVEWCNQSRSIKYLFKYVNKGNDRVTAEFYKTTSNADGVQVVDEINMYNDCRYVSKSKATWRLLNFEIQCRNPPIERLSFHLPDSQTIFFQDDEDVGDSIEQRNFGAKYVHTMYNTFKEVCYARGLLQDDTEYVDAIMEASHFATPHSLRKLFVTLLLSNTMARLEIVWEKVWTHLADDAQHTRRRLLNLQDIFLTDEEKMNWALFELSKFLLVYNKTLRDFPNMPEKHFCDVHSSSIRAKGEFVINVASSGIASLLLPGGRTAHSSQNKTFGGKTVILGGDFRQILPVVPKGSRQDIVSATINSSYLWRHYRVMRLTKNSRLTTMEPLLNQDKVEEFANWLISIGDGNIGVDIDDYADFDIPTELLLKSNGDHISSIVKSTFPNFTGASSDGSCFKKSAILAPTLEVVNEVNQYMFNLTEGEGKTYLSFDTTCKGDGSSSVLADVHAPEFLNTITASGLPNHSLTLKVGSPVMLIMNIDHSLGLCNGTRLVVTKLGNHVVEGSILAGPNAGTKVLIARMTITPSDPRLPFKFNKDNFHLCCHMQ